MKTFEYLIWKLDRFNLANSSTRFSMNYAGEKGWELVTVVSEGTDHFCIYKRELPHKTRKAAK